MNFESYVSTNLPDQSFKKFLFGNRRNKRILWLSTIAIISQFLVFKYFYPFVSYIHGDSFVYLRIANENSDIDSYMVGYGRFLRLFSVFSSSDFALAGFQYLLIQISVLLMLFTFFYFYRPGKVAQIILICFMVFNPLFLYMGNLVSSDGIFLALSFAWFAILLWIIHKPGVGLILLHALVLFVTFTVRYNALIYPAIAVGAFLLSRQSFNRKIIGIGIAMFLCGIFVLYTANRYRVLTGVWQYSPFSSWQIANNAMYAYRYVERSDRKTVPERYKALDKMIRSYFDSTRDVTKHPQEALKASTVYMWTPTSSLYKYRNRLFKNDSAASEFKMWASVGPIYWSYGLFIIRQYPIQYIRYFIWPNTIRYFSPPVEYLGLYNSGLGEVRPLAMEWFGYKSTKVFTRTNDVWIRILNFYPILSGAINVMMICCVFCFYILDGFQRKTLFKKAVLLSCSVWLLNAGFTIFASPAALRFQAFPILLTSTVTLLLVDWLWRINNKEINDVSREKSAE